ncbi:MAG: DUF3617 family protein [Asticcacaulis sp.]
MILRNACLILAASLLASAAIPATAAEKARQWEVDIQKTVGDKPVKEKTTWICMSDRRWANPPKSLTGAQCPDQKFTRDDDVLSWNASCDAAKGTGAMTFSHGDKRVEGKSVIDVNGVRTVTEIEGRAVDRCSL